VLITFKYIKGKYNSISLVRYLGKIIDRFKLSKRISTIIIDNISNNTIIYKNLFLSNIKFTKVEKSRRGLNKELSNTYKELGYPINTGALYIPYLSYII